MTGSGPGGPRPEAFDQFSFLVDFGQGELGGFSEMTGLEEGAARTGQAPGGLVGLKRGLCSAGALDWLSAGGPARIVTVVLRDERLQPVVQWILADARPVRFEPPATAAYA